MISPDQLLIDQLDNYLKGTLPSEERIALETKMQQDNSFRQKAEEHFKLIGALHQYDEREKLKILLDSYHQEIRVDEPLMHTAPKTTSSLRMKRYWPTIAVAATVACISIIGTLLTTRSLKNEHTADYKELRRNVEQIKKSQKALMADIKEVKDDKESPLPGNYEGTGFLISADGYMATSYHVIRDADSVYLENEKFGRLKAEVIKVDLKKDVAILKIKDESFNAPLPYNISDEDAFIGENVFTLGFPREDVVYGEGTISSSTGYGRNKEAYQISVPVNPGNSGGPLLNKQGQLIGIISGVQTETLGAAFAVKSSVLLSVIGNDSSDSLSLKIQLPKQNKLKNLNRVEQLKKLQDFVFVLKVYNSK